MTIAGFFINDLNNSMILLINALAHPDLLLPWAAKFFAAHAILLIPISLLAGWLWGIDRTRKLMLEATASGLAGLLMAQIIGLVYFRPRPFMAGLGHLLIPHAPSAAFPSEHLTLIWALTSRSTWRAPQRLASPAPGCACTAHAAWSSLYLASSVRLADVSSRA